MVIILIEEEVKMFNDGILISIKPKYCKLIAEGRKLYELRKTKPNLKLPFKCYIYCTKDKKQTYWYGKIYRYIDDHSHNAFDKPLNGKIIGEFICDGILGHCEMANADIAEQYSCVKREDIFAYSNGKEVFGWHISNLVVYDEPKELDDFIKRNIPSFENLKEEDLQTLCKNCHRTNFGEQIDCIITQFYNSYECDMGDCEKAYKNYIFDNYSLKRPPQSWCFVKMAEDYYRSIGQ